MAMRIASVGHAVFAATLIALGILGLIKGDFLQAWQVPKGLPGRELLAYVYACISLACGIGLLWRRSAASAARVLLAFFLLLTLLFKARYLLIQPTAEGTYQSLGENAVLVAGAWVLYAWFATDWDRRHLGFASGETGVRIARVLYGLAMIAFGLSHFAYLNLTAPLVPAWLPWHVGFSYFTGCAYLAAGVAMLIGVCARLAAVLSTAQMAGFTLLVWVPLWVSGDLSTFQQGELVASWALTAAGWVVADSYRGMPWLASRKRAALSGVTGNGIDKAKAV
jgi:uncharacterized membrane protein